MYEGLFLEGIQANIQNILLWHCDQTGTSGFNRSKVMENVIHRNKLVACEIHFFSLEPLDRKISLHYMYVCMVCIGQNTKLGLPGGF